MSGQHTAFVSAGEALRIVESCNRVFIHGSAATPLALVQALFARAWELHDVELVSISTMGDMDWDRPEVMAAFYLNSLFVSGNVRDWVAGGRGDYLPVFLSEIPKLFRKNILPLDVALIQVSPPDKHGYCTLGTSVDAALSAVQCAGKVIAQINPLMPRTHGDGHIHISRIHAMTWAETPLPEVNYSAKADDVSDRIGQHIAALVENGATLQMGIGAIPDAALRHLGNHKELGVHTEMFSDGIIPLIERGVITNGRKSVCPGKTVTSFVAGTRRVYDFVDDNPEVAFLDVAFVNDSAVIRQNPKVTAINSALEIDITGQVCADSIGTYQYSGIGGQLDFMRGAALSEGGKPIIALPSVTRQGLPRIVPQLKPGAGVVTTRGDVHYVVTEYGTVDLYGKNMVQRARLLLSISHPDHQENLERACFERFKW